MQNNLIRLWDLPTRLFHWLLFLLVAAAFVTGLSGGNLMVWHGRLGLAILGLLTFRLVWGLIGSTYARFSQFVRGPGAILAYLRGQWDGIGHNPLGALSVLALLGLLLLQTLSGLMADDDIAFKGPLAALVSTATSAWLTGLHRQAVWILGSLVALHVGVVLFYTFARRDNLILPMLHGRKAVDNPAARSAVGGGPLALILAVALAALTVWVADGGLLSPPPPSPGSVPSW
ncbi:cytochrome b/b6 domain-containing protein [uncultured Thiocystis sp.]|jgi:cytochrome b|uniref:cytochrome b/b6 domain-containing protein n=1 Tax=uncultured Thiocystis sp. TaxID=1202134 RepID=UPI0025CE6071|nr:cytochrome b/b6 domain-containing protein [uncultured Thiocystis sp.]